MTLDRLVLLRHGETRFNRERRVQGHLDAALSERGVQQAARAARVVARYAPELLLTSDLSRAADTAAELAVVCDVGAKPDPRLRETSLGVWEGLTHGEIEARWPGQFGVWRTNPRWSPEGGETRIEVATRAMAVVAELDDTLSDTAGATAVLSTHGGLIVALTASMLGLPTEHWSTLSAVGNCRWTVLHRRDLPAVGLSDWRLVAYNLGVDDLA